MPSYLHVPHVKEEEDLYIVKGEAMQTNFNNGKENLTLVVEEEDLYIEKGEAMYTLPFPSTYLSATKRNVRVK